MQLDIIISASMAMIIKESFLKNVIGFLWRFLGHSTTATQANSYSNTNTNTNTSTSTG